MGSFNLQCGLTGMNINYEDPCYIIYLEKSPYYDTQAKHYVNCQYIPTSFAQPTTYEDYGCVAPFELSNINKILSPNRLSRTDVEVEEDETKEGLFVIFHKTAYETFSKNFLDETYLHHRNKMIYDLGSKYYMNMFQDLLGNPPKNFPLDVYKLHNEIVKYGTSETTILIMRKVDDFLYTNKDGAHELLNEDFAEALVEHHIFMYNLDKLNIFLRPSRYASQDDNNNEYKLLAETILKINDEKIEKYDDYD